MQYLINSMTSLFVSKKQSSPTYPKYPHAFSNISPKPVTNDQLYDYIVEKSRNGPKGTYMYSDPLKNIHYTYIKSA